MATLTLIKHSMPAVNPLQPAIKWHLSPDGQQRCTWLANELKKHNLSVLHSSVEPKARETAAQIAPQLGYPVQTHMIPGGQTPT